MDPSDDGDQGKEAPETEKKTKTKMVRYTREQIAYCMANSVEFSEDRLPKLAEALSKELVDKMEPEIVAKIQAIEKHAEEAREEAAGRGTGRENVFGIRDKPGDVLKQYYAKGYAEYEVVVGEEEDKEDGESSHGAAAGGRIRVPAPGRRRFRDGVVVNKSKAGGATIRARSIV
uniref:Uncharacterized protein n=1 Tax=Leersia perrieri TaxID=77586 RepID=A0A0D9XUK6_9ORYZ